MKRLGLVLTFAAVAASTPWLVLLYLAADRVELSRGLVSTMLVLAGIPTALVLTAGSCYLAHSSVTLRSWPLALGTLGVLVLEVLLLAPLRVAQLAGQQLHHVLDTSSLRWGWAVLAVIAPDAVAALCSWAATAHDRRARPTDAPAAPKRVRRLLGAPELSIAPSRGATPRAEVGSKDAGESMCSKCSRPFATVKARAGHERWCGVKR